MNDLMHEVINKFNNINIMAGALALELESGKGLANAASNIQERTTQLLQSIDEDFSRSQQLLNKLSSIISGTLNCYKENLHFFEKIEPAVSDIENEKFKLKALINKKELSLPVKDITEILHKIEEKSLACAVTLKELRSSLIKSGKYQPDRA